MLVATLVVPSPKSVSIVQGEVFFDEGRPRHEMPTVVRRQVDAVGLMVGGDDDAADVEHTVLSQILLVHVVPQDPSAALDTLHLDCVYQFIGWDVHPEAHDHRIIAEKYEILVPTSIATNYIVRGL
jgi:hypothetical protein